LARPAAVAGSERPESMAEVKELVDSKIGGKKVMVFAKPGCPYCKKAKETLDGHLGKDLSPEDYEFWEFTELPEVEQIKDYLKELTGARTVSAKQILISKVSNLS
jgi:glutaredoxin